MVVGVGVEAVEVSVEVAVEAVDRLLGVVVALLPPPGGAVVAGLLSLPPPEGAVVASGVVAGLNPREVVLPPPLEGAVVVWISVVAVLLPLPPPPGGAVVELISSVVVLLLPPPLPGGAVVAFPKVVVVVEVGLILACGVIEVVRSGLTVVLLPSSPPPSVEVMAAPGTEIVASTWRGVVAPVCSESACFLFCPVSRH